MNKVNDTKMRVVVMGCGGSGGVPYAGNVWLACDPNNPKNHRTRPSIFIEKGDTRLVIDTGPEFRLQINRVGVKADQLLTGVLYTHSHCDHIFGMDDLRTFWHRNDRTPVDVYGTEETFADLRKRFDYCFEEFSSDYPATVRGNTIEYNKEFTVGDLTILPLRQEHGNIHTTGFRIGDFAYSTDVSIMPADSLEALKGVKTWIVGSFHNDEGCHNHVGFSMIKEWVNFIKPEMTYLTHLTAQADYDALCKQLPPHIRPAYDGLEIEV